MSETYTERKALKEYIEWIREERRKLSDEYWKSIERLRELDEKAEQDLKEYPEVIDKLVHVIEKQTITVRKMNEQIPQVPLEEAVKQFNVTHAGDEGIESFNEKYPTITQLDREIERQKDADERNSKLKRRKQQDGREIANEIVSYLKASGQPVKMKEVTKYLEEKGYKISNPTIAMNTTMMYESRVERVTKGYYQYR